MQKKFQKNFENEKTIPRKILEGKKSFKKVLKSFRTQKQLKKKSVETPRLKKN